MKSTSSESPNTKKEKPLTTSSSPLRQCWRNCTNIHFLLVALVVVLALMIFTMTFHSDLLFFTQHHSEDHGTIRKDEEHEDVKANDNENTADSYKKRETVNIDNLLNIEMKHDGRFFSFPSFPPSTPLKSIIAYMMSDLPETVLATQNRKQSISEQAENEMADSFNKLEAVRNFVELINDSSTSTTNSPQDTTKKLPRIHDDDYQDEQYEITNHFFAEEIKHNKPFRCMLFRYLPGCSCNAHSQGGSICSPGGVGRCDRGQCLFFTRRMAKTAKMLNVNDDEEFKSALLLSKRIKDDNGGQPSESIAKNYYLLPTLVERIFRTKLDLQTNNQDFFMKKAHHLCRSERVEYKDKFLSETNNNKRIKSHHHHHHRNKINYRCRTETYPFNPTKMDPVFLRDQRTPSPLIRAATGGKSKSIFIRLFCTVEFGFGITNVDLSFGGCINLAIDMMTRNDSIVVDVVLPVSTDHRGGLGEPTIDLYDFEFLRKIAAYHGINVMISASSDDNRPPLYPEIESRHMHAGGCHHCIWRVNDPPGHCHSCGVLDSRLLGGPSILLNTGVCFAEINMSLGEVNRLHRKLIGQQTDLDKNASFVYKPEPDDVFFSAFRGKEILKKIEEHVKGGGFQNQKRYVVVDGIDPKLLPEYQTTTTSTTTVTPTSTSDTTKEAKQSGRSKRGRRLEDERDRQAEETAKLKKKRKEEEEEVLRQRRQLESTPMAKLSPNDRYKLENPRHLQRRVGEDYLLSIRVTGVHFTTYLEERSASWLPALDWLQPSEKVRNQAKQTINKILEKSLDGKTYLAVHLRYEEDALTSWISGVRSPPGDDDEDDEVRHNKDKEDPDSPPPPPPLSPSERNAKKIARKNEKLQKWIEANKDRNQGIRRPPPKRHNSHFGPGEQGTYNLMSLMERIMQMVDQLSIDLNVGAVFISNDAPIGEYTKRYDEETKTIARRRERINNNTNITDPSGATEELIIKRKHRPWFSGSNFYDKSLERNRYSSLIDRVIIESSTVGVVWDPYTGVSSFSQKIFDHRCRRMKGLTTFSYSVGAGVERDDSLVLEC